MSKIAVVYWSGTGNTEAMANEVAEGAKEKGAEVTTLTASEFSASDLAAYDAVAFGCLLWEQRILRNQNLSLCSLNVREAFPVRRLHFLAHMAGEVVNGWMTGQKDARMQALTLSQLL